MRALSCLSLLAVTCCLLTGCSGESDAPREGITLQVPGEAVATSSAPVSAPAPRTREPGDPCRDAQGECAAVATVDVDGDDALDEVGIELWDERIIVRIDNGSDLRTVDVADKHIIRTDVTPSGVFVGAFPITRSAGADLVVDGKFGLGGYELFSVVGWDDGPVLVPAPEGARSSDSLATEWAFPTERVTVLARCSAPASVSIITSEGDSSYGEPVLGGAYTETITSRWFDGGWSSSTTDRVAGETRRNGRVASTSTFECDPVQQPPPSSAAPADAEGGDDPALVFGGVGPSNSQGYGENRPSTVYFGGSPSGMIYDIVWSSWGGDRAVGTGTAVYVEPGGTVADAQPLAAEVVAFDISQCDGARAYSKVHWYFPSQGQSFDPAVANGVC